MPPVPDDSEEAAPPPPRSEPAPAAAGPSSAVPTCEGGETVVWSNGSPLVSKATTTPGGALLFRKDLKHEGRVLTAGQKHIVTLNLWAVRRSSPQVLMVTFPAASAAAAGSSAGSPGEGGEGGKEGGKRARLLEMSRADSYAIDVALLPRAGPLADVVAMSNEAAVREWERGGERERERERGWMRRTRKAWSLLCPSFVLVSELMPRS